MEKQYKIAVINIGSTSTKIAYYISGKVIFTENVDHSAEEISKFKTIPDQLDFRKSIVMERFKSAGIDLHTTDAISGICTGLLPMPGGTYEVNELMYKHGEMGIGSRHPGNLGPMLVYKLAKKFDMRGFVVNPSSIDEFCDMARLTGLVDIIRSSRGHPLNQKEVAIRHSESVGKKYKEVNYVVVHMGGGISICAHKKGELIDGADSTNGEGRMAPTRTGGLPAASVVDISFSGKYTKDQLLNKIQNSGGWVDLLGISDAREVEKNIENGDEFSKFVYETTAYQISKDIGAYSAVLSGEVEAILLTGGLAHSKYLTKIITDMVSYIAPIHIYPGEFEMEALASGALRVLNKEETPLIYTGEPVFKGFPGRKNDM